MFRRPVQTYDVKDCIIDAILLDEANPLLRIALLIPDGAKVLDIGAGNGLFARIVNRVRVGVVIDGIEPEPYAATIAQQYYRNFYTGYSQEFSGVIRSEAYDFVVLADVIEHLPDPLGFMENLCVNLSARARIVLSIPNVAFGAVRVALLKGDFDYVDSGLLERTHLRFFTLRTIKDLVRNLEVNVEKLFFLRRNIFSSEIEIPVANICCMSKILRDDLAWVYQFLVVLTKEQVITGEKHFGGIPDYPLIQYLFSKLRLCLKRKRS